MRVGDRCLVPDPSHGWASAQILQIKGNKMQVKLDESGKKLVTERAAFFDTEEVGDLLDLEDVDEGNIFHCLYNRYKAGEYYTHLGSNYWIFVNPNTAATLDVYTADYIRTYRSGNIWSLPPHVYALAARTYNQVAERGDKVTNCTIVLNGEEGSGKSTVLKGLLGYWSGIQPTLSSGSNGEKSGTRIRDQVMMVEPILQSFGYAHTQCSSNSCRFGSYTRLFFDNGSICAAQISTFLFDSARAARFPVGERNFNIFYQLIAGASPEERKSLFLLEAQKFNILKHSIGDNSPSDQHDKKQFRMLRKMLLVLGIGPKKQSAIFRFLAGLLHLGNTTFGYNQNQVVLKTPRSLSIAGRLLGIDADVIGEMLCDLPPPPAVEGEAMPPPTQAACNGRDAIIRVLYLDFFRWIIGTLNARLSVADPDSYSSIGILQSFGFEVCAENLLQQLLANYTSERLQAELVEMPLNEEQEHFEVDWDKLNVNSAGENMQMFDKEGSGIWSILTEESLETDSVDLDFVELVVESHAGSDRLAPVRDYSPYHFMVDHAGGEVVYNALGILEGNREYFPGGLLEELRKSRSGFVRAICALNVEGRLASERLHDELDDVMSVIPSPPSLFHVFCLAPCLDAQPDGWKGDYVLTQLHASGILDVADVHAFGYVRQFSYPEFFDRFNCLLSARAKLSGNVKKDSKRLLKGVLYNLSHTGEWLCGPKRLLLKHHSFRLLESRRLTQRAEAARAISGAYLGAKFLRRLRAVLPESPKPKLKPIAAAGRGATLNAKNRGSGESGAHIVVELTKLSQRMVVLVHEPQVDRGQLLATVRSVRDTLSGFDRDSLGTSSRSVAVAMDELIDVIKKVSRDPTNRKATLPYVKTRHATFLRSVKEWRLAYAKAKRQRTSAKPKPKGQAVELLSVRHVAYESPMMRRKNSTSYKTAIGNATRGTSIGGRAQKLDQVDASFGERQLKKDFCFVHYELPNGVLLRARTPTKKTGLEVIQFVLASALELHPHLRDEINTDAGAYRLKVFGLKYAVNEQSVLSRTAFVQASAKMFVVPVFELTPRSKRLTFISEAELTKMLAGELKLYQAVKNLIGDALEPYLNIEDVDMTRFRSEITHERLADVARSARSASSLEGKTFMLHEYKDVEPIPTELPPKIKVNLNLPLKGASNSTTMLAFAPTDTADMVREQATVKLRKLDPSRRDANPEDFLLKATGYQQFFLASTEMLAYDYTRNCICGNWPVNISLVERDAIFSAYSEVTERFNRESFLDKILESWMEDNPAERIDAGNAFELNTKNYTQLNRMWRVKINGVQQVPEEYTDQSWFCSMRVSVFDGSGSLTSSVYTKPVAAKDSNLRWDETLGICPINELPRGGRISLSLRAIQAEECPVEITDESDSLRIGWVNLTLFDAPGKLRRGLTAFRIWGEEVPYDPSCLENAFGATVVYVLFEATKQSIVYPKPTSQFRLDPCSDQEYKRNEVVVQRIIRQDPLCPISDSEKRMVWNSRHRLVGIPEALPKVLLCVNWKDFLHAQDAYTMISDWCPIGCAEMLQLVSGAFFDPVVRSFGVSNLSRLSDGEILAFVPQLTQALKYEPYHESDLAKMLVRRSLGNRHRIGHSFFWSLKAEMHLPKIAGRYAVLLESYLRGAGTHRHELTKQNEVINKLVAIAKGLKATKGGKTEKLEYLKRELRNMKMPSRFQLPLDPRYEVKGIIVDKCKFMDSAKMPLWLVFENAEEVAPPITVIFKEGDDLRQDILTIQMLRLMNNMWKENGMDLGMNPYGCIANGDEIGMIEVVMNAETTGGITRKAGGAKAVFKKNVMLKWLKDNNKSDESLKAALRNFQRSVAAYCVATYVLGIGDRHNDNVMMQKNGKFFHIDFGHFLGNYKKKFGIEREKTPFIFTPQFAVVLGGLKSPEFKEFCSLCGRLFNIVRANANLFITLFKMMVLTGIPELQDENDIIYLQSALHLDLNDREAAEHFEKLILEAHYTKTTQANDVAHLLRRK